MANDTASLTIRGTKGEEIVFDCNRATALSLIVTVLDGVGKLVLEGGVLIPVEDVTEICITVQPDVAS